MCLVRWLDVISNIDGPRPFLYDLVMPDGDAVAAEINKRASERAAEVAQEAAEASAAQEKLESTKALLNRLAALLHGSVRPTAELELVEDDAEYHATPTGQLDYLRQRNSQQSLPFSEFQSQYRTEDHNRSRLSVIGRGASDRIHQLRLRRPIPSPSPPDPKPSECVILTYDVWPLQVMLLPTQKSCWLATSGDVIVQLPKVEWPPSTGYKSQPERLRIAELSWISVEDIATWVSSFGLSEAWVAEFTPLESVGSPSRSLLKVASPPSWHRCEGDDSNVERYWDGQNWTRYARLT